MSDPKYYQCMLRNFDDNRSHIELGAIAEVKYNKFLKSKDENFDLDVGQVELKIDLGSGSRLDIIKVDSDTSTPCHSCNSVYLTPECKYPEHHCTYCYKYMEGELCSSILSHQRDPKKFIEFVEITKVNLQLLDLYRMKFGWDNVCFPGIEYLGKRFEGVIQPICIGAYVPELQDYKLGVSEERSKMFRKMHQVVHSSSIDRIFRHKVDSDIEIPRINFLSMDDMHSKITYRSGKLEDRHRDMRLKVASLDDNRLRIDMLFKTHEFLYLVELIHLRTKLPVQLCRIIVKLYRGWSS